MAATWFKVRNGDGVGALESWVHPILTMEMWKAVYSFKFNPIYDKDLW